MAGVSSSNGVNPKFTYVDGETVAQVEAFGVDRWLGILARDLKVGTYRPQAARQVLSPKKQCGKYRPGHQALEMYKRRWQIEVLFEALKSRGFNLNAQASQNEQSTQNLPKPPEGGTGQSPPRATQPGERETHPE